MVLNLLILLGVFIAMEGVTWCTHKFVMHGSMWYFHEDHHNPHDHFFEKNDAFFIIFALPSFLLILFGSLNGFDWRAFVGFGIMAYGLAYFLVHDVLIHRRFKWFDNIKNPYFRALRKAHKVHHKHMGKEDGECFGMLFVPKKYFIEAFKSKR